MPKLPCLQYENAIYHVVTRGDGRRRLFQDVVAALGATHHLSIATNSALQQFRIL